MKRLSVLLLALLFVLHGVSLAEETAGEWHFNEKGFLTGENPGEEYLLEDAENGIWQYASKDLSVKITRVREQYNKKKIREYCVAEIWASEGLRKILRWRRS